MQHQHSGMDAWRYVIQSESERSTVATYLPLILSAVGALGVLPFAILRFAQAQWIPAIVDTVIVLGLSSLGIYVYRTQRATFASIAISIVRMAGVLTTVYVIGPQQINWIYPGLMATFYLLRPREAIALALTTMAALMPALLSSASTLATSTVLITIVMMSAFAYAFSLITNRQREQLIQLATKDPLTGAGNRLGLDDKMTEVVNKFDRNTLPASIMLLDLDHFKKVNDVHGHAVGDQILQRITEIVNMRIRITDSLYRVGGEEFIVVLEGQDLGRAAHLAEQVRTLVEVNELVPDHAVTISIGVAELKSGETIHDWLHRADDALYCAKRAGRNTTSLAA